MLSKKRRFVDMMPLDKTALDAVVATLQHAVLEVRELDEERVRVPLLKGTRLMLIDIKNLSGLASALLDKEGLVVFKTDGDAFRKLRMAAVKRAADLIVTPKLTDAQKLIVINKDHWGQLETVAFQVRRHIDCANFEITTLGPNRYSLSTIGAKQILLQEALELAQALALFDPNMQYGFDGDELRVRIRVSI